MTLALAATERPPIGHGPRTAAVRRAEHILALPTLPFAGTVGQPTPATPWQARPEETEMGTFNPSMQKATLSAIDSDVHGLISKRTAELDGVSVTEVTFAPGARWSNDLKSYAGTELCELSHVAVVLDGRLAVQMADGSSEEFAAGMCAVSPPSRTFDDLAHMAFVYGQSRVRSRRQLSRRGRVSGQSPWPERRRGCR